MIVNTVAAYIILHHLTSTYYIIYTYIWYAGSMSKFRVYSLSMKAIDVG